MDEKMNRCKDCFYLIEGENGAWLCANCEYQGDEKEIHTIDECECNE